MASRLLRSGNGAEAIVSDIECNEVLRVIQWMDDTC